MTPLSIFSWQVAIFSEAVKHLSTLMRGAQALRALQVSLAFLALEQP